jgi:hypothetical protein
LLLCIDIPVPAHAGMVQGHTIGHLASAILVKDASSLNLSPQSEASRTMRRSANQMARTPSGLKLDRRGGGGGGLDSGDRSPHFFHGFLSQLPGGRCGGTSLALCYCHPCVGGRATPWMALCDAPSPCVANHGFTFFSQRSPPPHRPTLTASTPYGMKAGEDEEGDGPSSLLITGPLGPPVF